MGSIATVVVVEPVVETRDGSAVRAGGGDDVASNIRAFKIHQTAVLADHKGRSITFGVAAIGSEERGSLTAVVALPRQGGGNKWKNHALCLSRR